MPKPLRYLSPIHKAARQIGVYFEQRLDPGVLAPQEGHILSFLNGYAPCPINEVVTVFGLRGSTATSVLDRLEGRGLIRRDPNPDDRRSFLVDITAKGRKLAGEVQAHVEALEKAIAKRVSPEQEAGFRAVMEAIQDVTQVTLR